MARRILRWLGILLLARIIFLSEKASRMVAAAMLLLIIPSCRVCLIKAFDRIREEISFYERNELTLFARELPQIEYYIWKRTIKVIVITMFIIFLFPKDVVQTVAWFYLVCVDVLSVTMLLLLLGSRIKCAIWWNLTDSPPRDDPNQETEAKGRLKKKNKK